MTKHDALITLYIGIYPALMQQSINANALMTADERIDRCHQASMRLAKRAYLEIANIDYPDVPDRLKPE